MAERDLVGNYLRAIQAFNENDLSRFLELVAPEVTYTVHGQNMVAGVYRGAEEFGRLLEKAKELTNDTATLEPLAVLSDNEHHVMIWGRFRGTRDGRRLDIMHAYYYRFDQQGRLVEGHTIPADQQVSDEFWS